MTEKGQAVNNIINGYLLTVAAAGLVSYACWLTGMTYCDLKWTRVVDHAVKCT